VTVLETPICTRDTTCDHALMANSSQAGIKNLSQLSAAVPPQAWFGVSAIFHYLGPAFAVLLFPHVGVLGVAWLRIASA
jgi:inner membrane transporter RhtA